jgi:hypothetical protein
MKELLTTTQVQFLPISLILSTITGLYHYYRVLRVLAFSFQLCYINSVGETSKLLLLSPIHSLFNLIMQNALIHMKPSALNQMLEIANKFDFYLEVNDNELDVIVPDVEYKDGNHPDMNGIWEDPDVQLCNHYGIDYDQVNCIELAS